MMRSVGLVGWVGVGSTAYLSTSPPATCSPDRAVRPAGCIPLLGAPPRGAL